MPSPDAIALFARLGVVASVQPMFDGLWGGPDGMYAERLGERWEGMNPFAALAEAGVVARLRLGLAGDRRPSRGARSRPPSTTTTRRSG